jgi:hypothetical protein
MPRGFILYRPPAGGLAGVGEALRTRSVTVAMQRANLFLAECTDNVTPQAARLRVFEPYEDDPAATAPAQVATEASALFGAGALVPLSNEERVWEWHATPGPELGARVAAFVAFAAARERLPRIHVNAAVRRHGSPKTVQVEVVLEHELRLTLPDGRDVLPFQDDAHYLPGWGRSRLTLQLGPNRIWALLCFPFEAPGQDFQRCVADIEATGLVLAAKNFLVARPNARGDGYVTRKL